MNKNLKAGVLCLTVVAAAALMSSCSGSSSSDNTTSGGTSSTSTAGKTAGNGGSSSAGKTNNNGGSSSGGVSSNAGTTNNDNGGTRNNNGGTPNGGFTFGGFNFGGAGPDPADFMCMPAPTTGSACAAGTQPCLKGTAICYCQMAKWACLDLGGGAGGAGGDQLECPATQPANGTACGDTFGVCPYGQNAACACVNTMWACQ
jgi:hypothetical protein